jgi:phosphohistidine phosphatase SixA
LQYHLETRVTCRRSTGVSIEACLRGAVSRQRRTVHITFTTLKNRKPPQHSQSTIMAPRAVHFIRHAQGYHNVHNDQTIPDPDLTPKGRKQCKHLSTVLPYFDSIDLVCASPIRRAIQTASISMEPYLHSIKSTILALPLAQEPQLSQRIPQAASNVCKMSMAASSTSKGVTSCQTTTQRLRRSHQMGGTLRNALRHCTSS